MERYLVLQKKSFQICINGTCVTSLAVSNSNCLFEDSSPVSEAQATYPLPFSNMSCTDVLNYFTKSMNYSAYYFCQQPSFLSICCEACQSMSLFNFNLKIVSMLN